MTEDDLALLLAGLDADPDGVVVFDRDRRIRHMNAAGQIMAGISLDLARGRQIPELAAEAIHLHRPIASYTILHDVLGQVMATGVAHLNDDAARMAEDGAVVPISMRLLPIMREGIAVGAVIVLRDHLAEGSLMFRHAAVAMVHVDRDGTVWEANRALLGLLGREQAELRGVSFASLLHPTDAALAGPIVDQILRREATEGRLEVRLVHADGSTRWADLSISGNGMGRPGSGGVCAILQDVTERVQLQAELEGARARLLDLAQRDPLTGLPNRTRLADELAAAQDRAAVAGTHVAVLFIDLDGFKRVNDTAGHHAGDRLLVEVSRRLRDLLRPDDVAARIGGDEFVLCCPELSTDHAVAQGQAGRIADRVRVSLSQPFQLDGVEWTLSASVGIALSRAGDVDPAALLRTADADMYRLKAAR